MTGRDAAAPPACEYSIRLFGILAPMPRAVVRPAAVVSLIVAFAISVSVGVAGAGLGDRAVRPELDDDGRAGSRPKSAGESACKRAQVESFARARRRRRAPRQRGAAIARPSCRASHRARAWRRRDATRLGHDLHAGRSGRRVSQVLAWSDGPAHDLTRARSADRPGTLRRPGHGRSAPGLRAANRSTAGASAWRPPKRCCAARARGAGRVVAMRRRTARSTSSGSSPARPKARRCRTRSSSASPQGARAARGDLFAGGSRRAPSRFRGRWVSAARRAARDCSCCWPAADARSPPPRGRAPDSGSCARRWSAASSSSSPTVALAARATRRRRRASCAIVIALARSRLVALGPVSVVVAARTTPTCPAARSCGSSSNSSIAGVAPRRGGRPARLAAVNALNAASLDNWQFPLLPVDPPALLYLVASAGPADRGVLGGGAVARGHRARDGGWAPSRGGARRRGRPLAAPLAAVLILRPRGIDIPPVARDGGGRGARVRAVCDADSPRATGTPRRRCG